VGKACINGVRGAYKETSRKVPIQDEKNAKTRSGREGRSKLAWAFVSKCERPAGENGTDLARTLANASCCWEPSHGVSFQDEQRFPRTVVSAAAKHSAPPSKTPVCVHAGTHGTADLRSRRMQLRAGISMGAFEGDGK
jgi:hypothetical protein